MQTEDALFHSESDDDVSMERNPDRVREQDEEVLAKQQDEKKQDTENKQTQMQDGWSDDEQQEEVAFDSVQTPIKTCSPKTQPS